jgi:hypothetical protein
MKKILLISSIILIVSWCTNSNYIWYYYPDKNDLLVYEESWKLNSIEECRNWVDSQWYNEYVWDYECWYKCKFNSDYWMNICKTTEK